MKDCRYCTAYSNPFKMQYSPLWFAWRPVKTSDGIRFLKKVHKVPDHYMNGNLVCTWPVTYYTFEVCKCEEV